MPKVSTPNLDHLVKTRGDIHDLKELRALKAVARAVDRLLRWRADPEARMTENVSRKTRLETAVARASIRLERISKGAQ